MDLKSTQLKDTYGNLLTIGTSAGSPQTGTLQNGDGEDITALDIAGTITADGLTVTKGSVGQVASFSGDDLGGARALQVITSTTTNTGDTHSINAQSSTGILKLSTNNNTERLSIYPTGDIIFRDGSANQAFYWDASTARLGLGTTSPATVFEVEPSYGEFDGIKVSRGAGFESSQYSIINQHLGGLRLTSVVTGGGSAGVIAFKRSNNGTTASESMRIDATGNVGIGTTSPSEKLQINSGYIKVVDNAYDEYFFSKERTDGSQLVGFQSHSAGALSIHSAGSEAMRIDSSGKVGIGTTSPTEKLQIVDSANDVHVRIGSGNAGINPTLRFHGKNTADTTNVYADIRVNPDNQTLGFSGTGTSGGSIEQDALVIDSSGNVGIGVSPSRKLSVNGAADFGNGTIETIISFSDRGIFGTQSNHDLEIRTNGTERMRITASGNVGIGTTNPGAKLHVSDTGSNQLYLERTGAITGKYRLGVAGATNRFYITDVAQSADRVVILENGNVGIGTSSALSKTHISSALNSGAVQDTLLLSQNTSTSASGQGVRLYLSSSNSITRSALIESVAGSSNDHHLAFYTNGAFADPTERMRIDSSGDVLVGKTTVSLGAVGVEVKPNGEVRCTTNGAQTLQLNRLTSDGTIVDFRKDSTTVGSIGTKFQSSIQCFYIAGSATGIGTYSGGIYPSTSDGGFSDGTKDLGTSSVRFKDLYLSGSVYLGGTTSANALDDYEEGTFTPVVAGTWTANPTSLVGKYTKIGNVVHVQVTFLGGTKATATSGYLEDLPFAASHGTGAVVDSEVIAQGSALFANTDRIWFTDNAFAVGTNRVTGTYLIN
jgi:hypothetical protein